MKRNRSHRLPGAVLGLVLLAASAATPASPALEQLLERYRSQGAGEFSPARGAALWEREVQGRSCRSCHTDNPQNSGEHVKTRKPIEPLAPSANAKRLTDPREMKKWLLRNCKWTLGRTCTVQEKGDFLTWLREQ